MSYGLSFFLISFLSVGVVTMVFMIVGCLVSRIKSKKIRTVLCYFLGILWVIFGSYSLAAETEVRWIVYGIFMTFLPPLAYCYSCKPSVDKTAVQSTKKNEAPQ